MEKMSIQFITLFDDISRGKPIDIGTLPPIITQNITEWYCQLFKNCESIDVALDLMYYFYLHDDIDVYHVTEFRRQCTYLEKAFSLPPERVLDAIITFRNLVYKDEKHAKNSNYY